MCKYYHKDDVLFKKSDAEDRDDEIVCSQYIKVMGYNSTTSGEKYSQCVEFKTADDKIVQAYIPFKELSNRGDPLGVLANAGFLLNDSTKEKALRIYLKEERGSERYFEIDKCGWNEELTEYICPSFQIGTELKNKYYTNHHNLGFELSGNTVNDWWKNVGKYSTGNPELATFLYGSFGASLKAIINTPTFFLSIIGKTTGGKTTSLLCASSIYGNGCYTGSWKATGNAMEGIFEQHNDALTALDEAGEADGKSLKKTVYSATRGGGKARMNQDANLKETRTWRTNVLSTGEVSIIDKIQQAGDVVEGGIYARVIDMTPSYKHSDTDTGIFRNLHGCDTTHDLIQKLRRGAEVYYGEPAERFVEYVYSVGSDGIRDEYYKMKAVFFNNLKIKDGDNLFVRCAEVFYEIWFAGCIAVKAGVIHIGEKEEDAIKQVYEHVAYCLNSWEKTRGGKRINTDDEVYNAFYDWCFSNKSLFEKPIDQKTDEEKKYPRHTSSMLGFSRLLQDSRRIHDHPEGMEQRVINSATELKRVFYIYGNKFKAEFCNKHGYSEKQVKRILEDKGVLEMDKTKGNKQMTAEDRSGFEEMPSRMMKVTLKIAD